MKILITGGAGFIGSHLCKLLALDGDRIVIIDDLSTGKLSNLQCFKQMEFIDGSILDEDLVNGIMKEVSVCYHLAASLGVKKIVESPIKSLESNIKGTEVVLNAAARYKVRTLLASSSEVYGKNPNQPLSEESDRHLGSPKITRWSYSEAKAINEMYAHELNKRSSLQITIARLFNTVGVMQSGDYGMVLPKIVSLALKNEPVIVYGDGSQSRTFTAVSDVVIALRDLIKTERTINEVYNVGGDNPITITELAQLVISMSKSKSKIIYKPFEEIFGSYFEEPKSRIPDITKIQETIGWSPIKSIDEIVLEVIEYQKSIL